MASASASKYDSKSAGEDSQLESEEAHGLPISTSGNATSDLGSGVKFLQAIADVRSAVEHAVQIGEAEMATADLLYYAGLKTLLDPTIVDAVGLLKQAETRLNRLGDLIGGKATSAAIYKLPPEVMCLVFGHLDTEDLFTSEIVCQYWKGILGCSAALQGIWRETTAALHGTLRQMNARWTRLLTKVDSDALESVSIKITRSSDYRKDGEDLGQLDQIQVFKQFPSKQLRRFEFASDMKGPEKLAWHAIQRCQSLQVLHWATERRSAYSEAYEYRVYDWNDRVPFMLEELRFDSDRTIINAAFVQTLCQVKRLYLISGMSKDHVLAILNVAQSHLEEVSISGISSVTTKIWVSPEPGKSEAALTLGKLRSISIQGRSAGVFHVNGPNVAFVHFDHGDIIDRTLLNTCRKRIKSLHIETKGVKTGKTIIKEVFDMPQLEELHLDYRPSESERAWTWRDEERHKHNPARNLEYVSSYERYSTPAFWQIGKRKNTQAMQASLPDLKKLKIVHDPLLNEEVLLQFLELRSRIGQPALEEVEIWLANHCSNDTGKLESYKMTTSGFQYSKFDQWKTKDTRQWSLETVLKYGKIIVWNDLKICRGVLKKLGIYQGDSHFDRRIGVELFDMPSLEELAMDFGTRKEVNENRSCSALWRIFMTATTGDQDVHLRDILPSLKSLTFRNDGKLNEEIITKMVELRESFGMKSIEILTVYAASRVIDDEARLDHLIRFRPDIAYYRYDYWSSYEIPI